LGKENNIGIKLNAIGYIRMIKFWLFISGLCILLVAGCCFGNCKPCNPPTSLIQPLVEFDTSGFSGFKWDELDSVDLYRFDANMVIVDTLHFSFTGKSRFNSIEAGRFDNFDHGARHATFYELKVTGHPKKYLFRDFIIRIIPNDPKKCCDCDGSSIENVTINDTVINIAQLPFKVSK
jgi:hypothetical protein